MKFATVNESRVSASKNIHGALCPMCLYPVIPCVGNINIPHFRHVSKENCDTWSDGITKWHLDWQDKFKDEFREVIITKNGEKHIADIKTTNGTVIEFQNSFISPDDIYIRELFYGQIVWVFNVSKCKDNIDFLDIKNKNRYWDTVWNYDYCEYEKLKNVLGYNWKYPKKHIFTCKRFVFLDIGDDNVYFLNFHNKTMPKFSHRSSTELENGYWESEVYHYYHPIKVVKKSEFISYYNK
jgi:competence CoiA-like predicted nuclease